MANSAATTESHKTVHDEEDCLRYRPQLVYGIKIADGFRSRFRHGLLCWDCDWTWDRGRVGARRRICGRRSGIVGRLRLFGRRSLQFGHLFILFAVAATAGVEDSPSELCLMRTSKNDVRAAKPSETQVVEREKGAYHRTASSLWIHRAVIFSRSRTLLVGTSEYFSSSAMGRTLANQ